MTISSRPLIDPALYPAGTQIESAGSALAWSAIMAGTATAIAVTLVLFTLGSGISLYAASAWPGIGAHPTKFSIGAGIWLIVTQWLSAALGGYIAGRLRVRWHSLHTDEVFFRDTAHGLLTWATSTVILAGVAVLATALMSTSAPPDTDITPLMVEQMRKAAATFSIFTAISMIVGAFIASVSAAMGGALRDRHP